MKKITLIFVSFVASSASVFAQGAPAPVPAPAVAAAPVAINVEDILNTALTEYKQKNFGKAAAALEKALAQLRQMKSETLLQYLPAAPQGWTIKEAPAMINLMTNSMGGSSAERIYQSGGVEIKLTINTGNSILRAMHTASATPKMQLLGYEYIFKSADPSKAYELNQGVLYVTDSLIISAKGKGITDQQAQGFIGLIDISKLKVEAEK